MPIRSTTCRFCGQGGDLYKGAHRACKNASKRRKLPDLCSECGEEPCEDVKGSTLDLCAGCRRERARVKSRAKMREHYQRKAAERKGAPKVARLCGCGCGKPTPDLRWKYTEECARRVKHEKDVARVKRVRAVERAKRPAAQPKVMRERPHAEPRQKPTFRPGPNDDQPIVLHVEQPRPVDVTGLKVTRIPSLMPASLRDFFGSGRSAAD